MDFTQLSIQPEHLFLAGLFATVTLIAWCLSGVIFRRNANPLVQRLRDEAQTTAPQHSQPGRARLTPAITRVSEAAGKPFLPKDLENQTRLRRQLASAGIYSSTAMQLLVGCKVIFMLAGGAIGYLLGQLLGGIFVWVFLYVGVVLGFLLPTMWLKRRIKSRLRNLERSLPDALDLMVVCVEAGLTLDAAIQRVGQEIAIAHPDIARELGITHMETRIGLARVDALRNLGIRTGSAAMQSLAAMLVQTERFGTSIAQALRIHGESLRSKRQYQAEEMAAKTTVKLAFPVVLFIFPTLLVVLGGPAVILFLRSPMFNGQ
jgi:tight adherence protein C